MNPRSEIVDFVHLGINIYILFNVSSSSHNCGCVVNGRNTIINNYSSLITIL